MLSAQGADETSAKESNDTKPASTGLCCYSGPTDCDGKRDYCSKSEANCAECGGTMHLDSKGTIQDTIMMLSAQGADETSAKESNVTKAANTGLCCYSGPTDCDGKRDYCSKSEANCAECGGAMHLDR